MTQNILKFPEPSPEKVTLVKRQNTEGTVRRNTNVDVYVQSLGHHLSDANGRIERLLNNLTENISRLDELEKKRSHASKMAERCRKACELKSLDEMIKERDLILKEIS